MSSSLKRSEFDSVKTVSDPHHYRSFIHSSLNELLHRSNDSFKKTEPFWFRFGNVCKSGEKRRKPDNFELNSEWNQKRFWIEIKINEPRSIFDWFNLSKCTSWKYQTNIIEIVAIFFKDLFFFCSSKILRFWLSISKESVSIRIW